MMKLTKITNKSDNRKKARLVVRGLQQKEN